MDKRNILIILNHQPMIPPFMITAITCAKDRYEEVYYINTKTPNNYKIFAANNNVHFLSPSKNKRLVSVLLSVFRLFVPSVFRDVILCIKEKGLKISSIKPFIVEQAAYNCLFPIAKRLITKKENKEKEITVLSTWLADCAFATAALKRKYPSIKAISLAHSYEVLTIRNPFVPYMHVNFKHRYLDGIYFISSVIRDMYFQGVGQLPKYYIDKTHVCYLGSYKDHEVLNQIDPDVFNICTCSRVIPLKRLDLLLDALKDWSAGKVKWTHLGDGPLLNDLQQKAKQISENNPYVEIDFIGRVPNSQVKAYYAFKPVDVFVNLSEIEGLPISIMEAISYGIPVIATDVGGTKEIVTSEVGILLKSTIDANTVREALLSFYHVPTEEKQNLRNSAYQAWQNNFDASKNLQHFFDMVMVK